MTDPRDELRRMGFPAALIAGATIHGKPLAECGADAVRVEASEGVIRIVIPGTPMSAPRVTHGDRVLYRPVVARYYDWRNRVREALGDCLPTAADVRALNWAAYFEPPRSWSKRKQYEAIGTLHRARPDRDNIDKAVLDCLYPEGDAAIAAGHLAKYWDWHARLEIEVRT